MVGDLPVLVFGVILQYKERGVLADNRVSFAEPDHFTDLIVGHTSPLFIQEPLNARGPHAIDPWIGFLGRRQIEIDLLLMKATLDPPARTCSFTGRCSGSGCRQTSLG